MPSSPFAMSRPSVRRIASRWWLVALLAASTAATAQDAAPAGDGKTEAKPASAKPDSQVPLEEIRRYVTVYNTVKQAYVEPVDDRKLMQSAIRGLLLDLDRPLEAEARLREALHVAEEIEDRRGRALARKRAVAIGHAQQRRDHPHQAVLVGRALAIGERYEEMIAADRTADSRYR